MSESDEVERVHAALDQTCNCGHHIDDHGSDIAGCYLCHDDGVPTPCERAFLDLCAEAIVPLLDERAAQARAEVANAFFQWGMKNEVSGVPLDWAWFGEITRRYSPRHEEYDADRAALDGGDDS